MKQAKAAEKTTNVGKTEVIPYDKVPKLFMEETGYKLADYSVGLGYYEDERARVPDIYGSGVFVKHESHLGILTAHHCAYPPDRELNLGNFGGHKLALVTKSNRHFVTVPPEVVQKHPIGIPNEETDEPDLAFLEISPCPLLDSLKAMVSFWPLNEKNFLKAKRLKRTNRPFAVIGFPGVYQTRIPGPRPRLQLWHKAYFYSIVPGGISKSNDWDYVVANSRYYDGHDLPSTFEGVSGGPVWALDVHGKIRDPNFKLADFCLMGIAFYQTPQPNGMEIKAHFIESIYHKAWQ